MNKVCLLGAAALIATAFLPDVASAQRGGGGMRGGGMGGFHGGGMGGGFRGGGMGGGFRGGGMGGGFRGAALGWWFPWSWDRPRLPRRNRWWRLPKRCDRRLPRGCD